MTGLCLAIFLLAMLTGLAHADLPKDGTLASAAHATATIDETLCFDGHGSCQVVVEIAALRFQVIQGSTPSRFEVVTTAALGRAISPQVPPPRALL